MWTLSSRRNFSRKGKIMLAMFEFVFYVLWNLLDKSVFGRKIYWRTLSLVSFEKMNLERM